MCVARHSGNSAAREGGHVHAFKCALRAPRNHQGRCTILETDGKPLLDASGNVQVPTRTASLCQITTKLPSEPVIIRRLIAPTNNVRGRLEYSSSIWRGFPPIGWELCPGGMRRDPCTRAEQVAAPECWSPKHCIVKP